MTREPLERDVSVDPGTVAEAGLIRSATGTSGRGVRATVLIGVTGLAVAWPFLSDFTVSLFATIALYAIVTAGLVLMTGVAGNARHQDKTCCHDGVQSDGGKQTDRKV